MDCFYPEEYNPYGVYGVRVYHQGKPMWVMVDDFIPCDDRGLPLFCRACDGREGWAMLLEKSYAKLHGSYAALEGGRCVEALVDLTGGVCETVPIVEEAEAVASLSSGMKKWHEQRQLHEQQGQQQHRAEQAVPWAPSAAERAAAAAAFGRGRVERGEGEAGVPLALDIYGGAVEGPSMSG